MTRHLELDLKTGAITEVMFPKPKTYRSEKYLAYVRTLPCCVANGRCLGQIIPHHVKSRGAGGSDTDTIPLCAAHHTGQGGTYCIEMQGKDTFARHFNIDLWQVRAETLAGYIKKNEP
jgi:hypothetical protein